MNHKEKFSALTKLAEGALYASVAYCASTALTSAVQNATETNGLNPASNEFWHIAYDSIPFTADFAGSAEVRAWFAANGYEW